MPNKSRWIHCDNCGRNQLHYAKGLCRQCYNYQWNEAHLDYHRQWRRTHREEEKERCRQWREANPGYHRQYNTEHRKEQREQHRQWRKVNKEYMQRYYRQWLAENPDKNREKSNRYRALKAGATIEPVDEQMIYERDGHMCLYCGETHKPLTLDHIEALNNGGSHCEDNLLMACRRCNSSKRDKPLEDWLQTQLRALVWIM